MCNNNHDILILKRYVNREADKLFKRLHKKLQEREAEKREYERRIWEDIEKHSTWTKTSFLGIKRPHVIVEITAILFGCKSVTGLGIARCMSKDEWSEEEGVRIATEKAVRHAARKLAGLE